MQVKAFPKISRQNILSCFDNLVNLYTSDQIKILDMAEQATATDHVPFVKNAGLIATQIATIRHRIERVANNYGRNVLIQLIEKLHTDLTVNGGAIGVNLASFCVASTLNEKDIKIVPSNECKWNIEWELVLGNNIEKIYLPLRDIRISNNDIVPSYVIQYVNQAIVAYNTENYLTSLSLISIALKGTLRDALEIKGYTYSPGLPTVDTYEFKEAHIVNSANDFSIHFPDLMPRLAPDFLSEAGMQTPHTIRLKRVKRNNDWVLEIRDANYLKDFWSSDTIVAHGQINISGLGTALAVSRNPLQANILDSSILAEDTDDVIQQVRNNLIHLSGNAMTHNIPAVNMTLEAFSQDQSRVFDTIWSISGAIEILYTKIANGTL